MLSCGKVIRICDLKYTSGMDSFYGASCGRAPKKSPPQLFGCGGEGSGEPGFALWANSSECANEFKEVVDIGRAAAFDVGWAGVSAAEVAVFADRVFADPEAAVSIAVFSGDAFPAFTIGEAAGADYSRNARIGNVTDCEVLVAVIEVEIHAAWLAEVGRSTEATDDLVRHKIMSIIVNQRADFC